MIKVVLIGAGNLAFHFKEIIFKSKKVKVIQWYNRTLKKIKLYANEVSVTDKIANLTSADIYIITVSDSAVSCLSKKIDTNALVVHCSGSLSINDLLCKSSKGVFYPLQTFSKEVPLKKECITFLIETEKKEDFNILQHLSTEMGVKSIKVNSKKRAYIHLIATITSNFINHVIGTGQVIAKKHKIPFDIFNSLIKESYHKAINLGAENSQTGPAVRNDFITIKKHLDLISDKKIKKMYKSITKSIQHSNEKKL